MMLVKKKILQIILLTALFAVFSAFSVSAKIYGASEDGISWSLDLNSGDMTVSGSGQMPDYLNYADTPWKEYVTLAKTITLDGDFTSIGNNAFIYAVSATEVVIPETVTEIGDSAFGYCSELLDILLPSELQTIGDSAFIKCVSLTEIAFPDTLTTLGDNAFAACTSLESADLSQTGIEYLGAGAFSGCSSLERAALPETLTAIGEGAFYECVKVDTDTGIAQYGLSSIHIPSGVTQIGDRAFFACKKLENITFGAAPLYIGKDAFYNIPAVFTVTFKNPDGSVIHSYKAQINTMASYTAHTPAFESDAQYHYKFASWDRPFEKVLGDTQYTAVYSKTLRSYTVTWRVNGNTDEYTYNYGETPVFWGGVSPNWHIPVKDGYTFARWSPEIHAVDGDVVYTAIFVFEGAGDVNLDGKVDKADLEVLAKYLSGVGDLTQEQLLRANMYTDDDKSGTDKSQNINIKDLVLLSQYIE